MRKNLSSLFSKAIIGAVGLAFVPTALPYSEFEKPGYEPPADPAVFSYWRYGKYDAVLKTWECEKDKLCAMLHSANPDDIDNKTAVAKMKGYGVREEKSAGRGQLPTHAWRAAPEFVSDHEIEDFVGNKLPVDVHRAGKGWKGTIQSPFEPDKVYGIELEPVGKDKMKISGFFIGFPLIKPSIIAERVPAPTPPSPPPPFAMPVLN